MKNYFEDDSLFKAWEPEVDYKKKKDLLKEKSYSFALRCLKLAQFLQKDKRLERNELEGYVPTSLGGEYILSKQILRSGTSIGASIREAKYAQSKADFISKFSISLKEANETGYWLELLKDGNYISNSMYESMATQLDEIIRLLASSIITAKSKLR